MQQKPVPDLFIILVNNPKHPLHTRNSFKCKIFLSLFFLSNPVPFNTQNYQKQRGPRTSDQLLFRLRKYFRKIPLLVMYYLTKFDDVIYSSFCVILKIKSVHLCKPIYDIINYSTSTSESRKCGKEGKKLQKFEYLENEKTVLDEINIFHSF